MPSLVICGDSFELPETAGRSPRGASPPPLSLLQIVPLARPALQLPLPRVHDEETEELAGGGEPGSLNSHCPAAVKLGGPAAAAAGHLTAAVLAPEDGASAAAPASAATNTTPTPRATPTRAR